MTDRRTRIEDRYRGAMLGTFLGDALGRMFEGANADTLEKVWSTLGSENLVEQGSALLELGHGRYTDDTQLTIALAEALLDTPGRLEQERVAVRFGENFDPSRCYGESTAAILEAVQHGRCWEDAVATWGYPGGSHFDGASMRVAPLALAFVAQPDRVRDAARAQAAVTGHTHPRALKGAMIQATMVHQALFDGCRAVALDWESPLVFLSYSASDYRPALAWIGNNLSAEPSEAKVVLGNGAEAVHAVPIALWCAISTLHNPAQALLRAVGVGGDTDTIAAMAGAIVGAFHGASAFPPEWIGALENDESGRDYVVHLADQLMTLAHENRFLGPLLDG